jgi:hypothetical protein
MVLGGPRASTADSVSILSLTMAVVLAQVGFSKAVLPCFFATSSA